MLNNIKFYVIAFLIYSYLGATLEHLSYYIARNNHDHVPKALGNPIITGFPLYGVGAYIIILINQLIKNKVNNIIIKFLIFALALTILEYLVGRYVGAGKNSYQNGQLLSWDYSKQKFNFQGIVTLRHFISWSILGLFVSELHPIIMNKIKFGFS